MAQGGPRPSAFYVERMAATRLPATPEPLTPDFGKTSLVVFGQTDPGAGITRPGDGILLTGLTTITISLWPEPGTTLTGGTMKAVLWSPFTQQWAWMPDLDLTVIAGTYTGPLGYVFAPLSITGRNGWVMNFLAAPLAGTSSTFLMRIDGFASAKVST